MAIVMRQLVDHIKETTPPKPTNLTELSTTNEELSDATLSSSPVGMLLAALEESGLR